jgi:hypothetical protein
MRSADVHDHDPFQFRQVHDLYAVRSEELAWSAGGFAPGVRLELVYTPIIRNGSGPRLIGNICVAPTAAIPGSRLSGKCS